MKYLLVLLLTLLLTACATSNYNYGRDFSSANVESIKHGTTTKPDLIKYFGEPFQKAAISATQEKWIYSYTAGQAKAKNYVFTSKIETTGTTKMLDILIENDVVVNHTFTEGQNPYNMSVN